MDLSITSIEYFLGFLGATAVILAIPGPTIITIVGLSLASGKRSVLPLVAGVALGDLLAVTLSLLGLGTMLQTSAGLFTVVKTIGGIYLLWLGFSLLRARKKVGDTDAYSESAESEPQQINTLPASGLFRRALVVTALNPKSIVFFLAFLPQFVDPEYAITPQLVLLGTTFVILGALVAFLYLVITTSAGKRINEQSAQGAPGIIGAALLCGAGVWALFASPSTH